MQNPIFPLDPVWVREPSDLAYAREMVRQQVLGDRELLRDIHAGREPGQCQKTVAGRLRYVESLALKLGAETTAASW